MEEIIIPAIRLLAEAMPGYKIKIPDPKTYRPIKDYYRVKAGITVVGGFSVPESDDFTLCYTQMWYGRPMGEKYQIESLGALIQLIVNQTTAVNNV